MNAEKHSTGRAPRVPSAGALARFVEAVHDRQPVSGYTHNFYRYPARFSPRFARAAIETFSQPGDVILDPFMGGGTAVVEGIAAGRHIIGNDLNALAAFVTKVKITKLTHPEVRAIRRWAINDVPTFTYDRPLEEVIAFIDPKKTINLTLIRARFIKKAIAAALLSLARLPSRNAQDFVRCVLLKVGQWALDGRARHTPLSAFREKLVTTTTAMIDALLVFAAHTEKAHGNATLLNVDAADLDRAGVFTVQGKRVNLVVTSPPYPGVHVLYHRWQVDGRRETPAPYWIAGCNDGQGASFYNFGDRREAAADSYFRTSLATLRSVRRVMRERAHMVQMVAFNRPDDQLPHYLDSMRAAGFSEVSIYWDHNLGIERRIWREVPHRKWYATLKGSTHASNEVVLIHQAV